LLFSIFNAVLTRQSFLVLLSVHLSVCRHRAASVTASLRETRAARSKQPLATRRLRSADAHLQHCLTPSYLQLSHKRINSGLYDIIIQQNRINVCLFHVAYSNTINLSCFLFFFVCFVFISLYMCISVFYCVIIIFVSNHTCIDHVHLLHVL